MIRTKLSPAMNLGFPDGSVGKESTCDAGDLVSNLSLLCVGMCYKIKEISRLQLPKISVPQAYLSRLSSPVQTKVYFLLN